jgi:hypothetical protein
MPIISRIGREIADAIAMSGVRVLGDLERLGAWRERPRGSGPAWSGAAWPEITAAGSMGVLLATAQARARPRRAEADWEDGVTVTAESSVARLAQFPGGDDGPVDLEIVSIRRLRKAFTTRLRHALRPRRRRRGARSRDVSADAGPIDDVLDPELAPIHSASEVE